eukprot:SAG22_NODE_6902_length_797_cov_0.925501_1_plen_169_part_10
MTREAFLKKPRLQPYVRQYSCTAVVIAVYYTYLRLYTLLYIAAVTAPTATAVGPRPAPTTWREKMGAHRHRHLFLAALAAAAGLRPGASAGRSVTVPWLVRRDPYMYSSDSSAADSLATRADVSFFGLTATAGAEQGTALEVARFADNSTAAVGLLPAGEVVSNGGGGV